VNGEVLISEAHPETVPTARTGVERRARTEKYAGFEILRILGVTGVATFHLLPASDPAMSIPRAIGHAVFYPLVIVMMALAAEPRPGRRSTDVIHGRAARLLVPWLVWLGLYFCYEVLRRLARGHPAWVTPTVDEVISGPRDHLWFLPFAFLTTVAAGLLRPSRTSLQAAITWAVAGAILVPVCIVGRDVFSVPRPIYQMVTCLPAVAVGVAAALGEMPGRPVWTRLAVAFVPALLSSVVTAAVVPDAEGVLILACGLLTAVAFWSLRRPAGPWLLWAAGLSMGVYLAHPLVGGLLWPITGRHPWMHLIVVFFVSALLVAVARRTSFRVAL